MQLTSTQRKILFDLLPSLSTLYIYAVFACAIVLAHVIKLTREAGVFLPNILGEEAEGWGYAFSQAFTNPSNFLSGGTGVGPLVVTAIVWGLGGLALYKLGTSIWGVFADAKATEKEVMLSTSGGVVRHPSRRFFFLHLAWQFFIGSIFFVSLIMLSRVVGPLLEQDVLLTVSTTVGELAQHGLIAVLGWMLVFYWFTLLLRLFRFFYIF